MSDCLHCDIHELLDTELQGKEANLAEVAAKVTEVLAELILTASPDDQATLMADILANLGSFLLEKKEPADSTNPRLIAVFLPKPASGYEPITPADPHHTDLVPSAEPQRSSERIKTSSDSKRKVLGVDDAFKDIPGVTTRMLVALPRA